MTAAMLIHGLLPRAWRLAFGEWEIPRDPGVTDDFHALTRSKVYRARLWLQHADTAWKSFVTCLVCGPVNHLMMQLQKQGAKGGTLMHFLSPTDNPFKQCLRSLHDLVTLPTSPLATLIPRQFSPLGKEIVWCILQYALGFCLGLAGRIWKELLTFYADWRYRLLGLVDFDSTPEARKTLATAFCSLKPCCLDESFTAKVLPGKVKNREGWR